MLLFATNRLGYTPHSSYVAGATEAFEAQVAASSDDAYEYISPSQAWTGDVDLTSGELPLGYDGLVGLATGKTVVGLRFDGVTLTQGQNVSLARLRFVSESGNTKPCVLRVWCQDADDASAFTTANGNISARTKTTAFADWNVPAWLSGQDDDSTLSVDVSALVKEVIDRAGWSYGNALAFLIELSPTNSDTESPRRRARSFDNASAGMARLEINTTGTPGGPTPGGDFSDEFHNYSYVGNESFNPASPTLKDGTSFTTDMTTYYTGFLHALLTATDTVEGLLSAFDRLDVYNMSRRAQVMQQSALMVFRLTGDLRILDRLKVAWDESWDHLNGLTGPARGGGVEWYDYGAAEIDARDLEWATRLSGVPWGTARKLLWYGGTHYTRGTHMNWLNEIKYAAIRAEIAWAFEANRGKTSPSGVNYGTEADRWAATLEEFVYDYSVSTTADWRFNHYGVDGGTGFVTGGSSRMRAPEGTWPIFVRDEGHAAYNSVELHEYLGLLGTRQPTLDIPNPSAALTAAGAILQKLADGFIPTEDEYGRASLIALSKPIAGGSNANRATYEGYRNHSIIGMYLGGRYPGILTAEVLLRLARQNRLMMKLVGNLTQPNHTGGVDYTGHGLSLTDGSGQTRTGDVIRGFSWPVFADEAETGGGLTVTTAVDSQNIAGGGFGTSARGHILPAFLFVKRALQAVGDEAAR